MNTHLLFCRRYLLLPFVLIISSQIPNPCLRADVTVSTESGFEIKLEQTLKTPKEVAFKNLTQEIHQWWDKNHTWSGNAANLKMDLDKGWLHERLPEEGWVRHMDIVFYQPNSTLRLTGGLGPLQGLGVSGTLTFSFETVDSGTKVTLIYVVHGNTNIPYSDLAPVVDRVLAEQLGRFVRFCDTGSATQPDTPPNKELSSEDSQQGRRVATHKTSPSLRNTILKNFSFAKGN